MECFGATDTGRVRSNNQDTFRLGELSETALYAVVCDGMGGANGGGVASSITADILEKRIVSQYRENMPASSVFNLLESAIDAANIEVLDRAMADTELAGMGTTVVTCVLVGGVAYIAHAGDSRAYRFNGEQVEQVTRDHSYVQRLIEEGTLTTEQAKTYPHRNVITRALGVNERLAVEHTEIELGDGEGLMLCTDGLTSCIDNEDMLGIFKKYNFYEYPDRLVKLANKRGGTDNITVVILSL